MAVSTTATPKANIPTTATTASAPAESTYVVLELVLYKRYYRSGTLYEADQAYRFTEDQAAILLAETEPETDRPVWRRYKPKAAVRTQAPGTKTILDAARNTIIDTTDNDRRLISHIDIGDDAELAADGIDLGGGVEV